MQPRVADLITSEHLSAPQRRFLAHFAEAPFRRRFYLAGGAGLSAGYLGHRASDDLDLFGPGQVPLKRLIAWMEGLPGLEALQWLLPRERTTFAVTWDDASVVKVEYRQFPFPAWVAPHAVGSLYLASAQDLATDKIYAATERRYELDRVDLFMLCGSGEVPDLAEIVSRAEHRFDLAGQLARPLAERLAEPLPDTWPPALHTPIDRDGLRGFIERATTALTRLW